MLAAVSSVQAAVIGMIGDVPVYDEIIHSMHKKDVNVGHTKLLFIFCSNFTKAHLLCNFTQYVFVLYRLVTKFS